MIAILLHNPFRLLHRHLLRLCHAFDSDVQDHVLTLGLELFERLDKSRPLSVSRLRLLSRITTR